MIVESLLVMATCLKMSKKFVFHAVLYCCLTPIKSVNDINFDSFDDLMRTKNHEHYYSYAYSRIAGRSCV